MTQKFHPIVLFFFINIEYSIMNQSRKRQTKRKQLKNKGQSKMQQHKRRIQRKQTYKKVKGG